MRIMFMGTPEFAKISLQSLIEHNQDVVCVITQPDKPKGRGYEMSMSEVKKYALEQNLPVFQPETLKNDAIKDLLTQYNPDIIVVVAYGKILPEYVLNYPKYGCINIHGSLLPKYRGAAPIQRAVIDGETTSGVTSMYMEKGLDTGDMLLKEKVEITPDMTSGQLHDILAIKGGEVLLKTLDGLMNKTITPIKQNDQESTYAHQLCKADGEINWNDTTKNILNLIRGLNPWPMCFSFIKGKRFVIDSAVKMEQKGNPGEVICADGNGLLIATADGSILVKDIKIEGKKKMSVKDYLSGHKIEKGQILGKE